MIIFYRLLISVKGPTNFHTRFAKIFKIFHMVNIWKHTMHLVASIGAPLMSQVPLLATHHFLFWLHPQQVVRQCYWRYWCPGILEFRWMWQWWDWPKWAFCVRKMDEPRRSVFCRLTCCLMWKRYFVTVWHCLTFFSQVMVLSVNLP